MAWFRSVQFQIPVHCMRWNKNRTCQQRSPNPIPSTTPLAHLCSLTRVTRVRPPPWCGQGRVRGWALMVTSSQEGGITAWKSGIRTLEQTKQHWWATRWEVISTHQSKPSLWTPVQNYYCNSPLSQIQVYLLQPIVKRLSPFITVCCWRPNAHEGYSMENYTV